LERKEGGNRKGNQMGGGALVGLSWHRKLFWSVIFLGCRLLEIQASSPTAGED
jgi:hypothetical protein